MLPPRVRTTRYLDTFFQMTIGVPYADLDRRLDVASVHSLCGTREPRPNHRWIYAMGIDTGKDFHVVVLARDWYRQRLMELVHVQTCRTFPELDDLMRKLRP